MSGRVVQSGPVIHTTPRRNLTLSEGHAPGRARRSTRNAQPEHPTPPDITSPDGTTPPLAAGTALLGAVARQAVIEAVALHLSPRAANPELRPSARMAYVAAALDAATRCPLCSYGGLV
jgi:hypothetical protein